MISFLLKVNKKMSKKREAIITTIGILIIIFIPTNIVADPRPYPHYHQYYEPATPSYEPQPYVSEHFTLTVPINFKGYR